MPLKTLTLTLIAAALLAACASNPPPTEKPAEPAVEAKAEPKPEVDPRVAEEQAIIAAVDTEHSVFFPVNGTSVSDEDKARLLEQAERLKQNPELTVTLVGHADHQGSRSYNLAIAEQRINAVFSILRKAGIPVTQIRRKAIGSEQVSAVCRSPECSRMMRRVQLIFGNK